MTRHRLLLAGLTTTLLATSLFATAIPSQARPAVASPAPWLDTSNRAAVAAAYQAEMDAPIPDPGWTGSLDACNPGTTTAAHKAATLRRVNFYRALAGLHPVTYDDSRTPAAQAAALVGAANGTITHELDRSARCYSDLAATGALTSNLAYGLYGPYAVDAFMDDGVGTVGHRTWFLLHAAYAIATGDVPQPASNAVTVAYSTPRPSRDGFVAYPNPGWFPSPLLHTSWSIHHPDADFTAATVSLSTPSGTTIPSRIVYAGNIVAPSLVFVPELYKPTADTLVRVTVSNATVDGVPTSFAYDVAIFVPNRAPVAQDYLSLTVPRCSRSNRALSAPVYSDPDGDRIALSVRPAGATPNVLAASPSGLSTTAPIDPSWGHLSFDVTITDPHGLATAMRVTLVPTGSRTCKTSLHPTALRRSTTHSLASLIPPPQGRRTWSATGGCRVVRDTLVTRIRPGSCILTVVAVRGKARWTLTRPITVK